MIRSIFRSIDLFPTRGHVGKQRPNGLRLSMSELRVDPDFDTFQHVSGNLPRRTARSQSPESLHTPRKGTGRTREELLTGGKREWLRPYETLPAQLFNAENEGAWNDMRDDQVWDRLVEPLPSGARWATELASDKVECRCIGVNRWLDAEVRFCRYQNRKDSQECNRALLRPEIYAQLYREIEAIMPSLEYCLAGRRELKKASVASLRCDLCMVGGNPPKDAAKLEEHAASLWQYLDVRQDSTIRMFMNWQSAGGLSFVAATHRRGMQCFMQYGNKRHASDTPCKGITLQDFQRMVRRRHS